MRCSSCEPLLDRYVEGTLKPREMIGVSAHVRDCETCRDLLDELKAVDGLLATTGVSDLPENFTFAIMAEVRGMPAPRARQHPVWSFLVLYSAAAWVAVVLAMILTGTQPASVLAMLSSALGRIGVVSSALASSFSHGFTGFPPALAAFSAGVLLVDVALAGAFALIYFVVRPRVAARLASSSESMS